MRAEIYKLFLNIEIFSGFCFVFFSSVFAKAQLLRITELWIVIYYFPHILFSLSFLSQWYVFVLKRNEKKCVCVVENLWINPASRGYLCTQDITIHTLNAHYQSILTFFSLQTLLSSDYEQFYTEFLPSTQFSPFSLYFCLVVLHFRPPTATFGFVKSTSRLNETQLSSDFFSGTLRLNLFTSLTIEIFFYQG